MLDEPKQAISPSAATTARGPVSIAFMFYLITLAAILSACLRTLVIDESVSGELLTRMIFIGILIGLLSGGLAGIFYFRGWKAITLGTIVGSVVGALAGCLSLVSNAHFGEIMWVSFFGCWLIILALLLTTRFQARAL